MASTGVILMVASCHRASSLPSDPAAAVAAIAVSPTRAGLLVADTLRLSASVVDAAGNVLAWRPTVPTLSRGPDAQATSLIGDQMGRTGSVLTWRSRQPEVATVDERGKVTARSAGVATIEALSGGSVGSMVVAVEDPGDAALGIAPFSATLWVGETLQLTPSIHAGVRTAEADSTIWTSDDPERVHVDDGRLIATGPGEVKITMKVGILSATSAIAVAPVASIQGLDFPGSARVRTTMRFEFGSPPAAFPATYVWRAYPRQQDSYYTAFFWGNRDSFFASNTYYGFHPYPDWDTGHMHFWEIAASPGGDFVGPAHVVYDRWYTQVAVAREDAGQRVTTFYWDWPDTTRVIRHAGPVFPDPPRPTLVVGDAPWNPGSEVWNGVLRGFQFYDEALTEPEIQAEVASPRSVREPWYLNLNPTPSDISDHGSRGHQPFWVGKERPALWAGSVGPSGAITTTMPPRP